MRVSAGFGTFRAIADKGVITPLAEPHSRDAVAEQLRRPLAGQPEDSALPLHIPRSTLARDCSLRTDVDDASARLLQIGQRVVRKIVIVQ